MKRRNYFACFNCIQYSTLCVRKDAAPASYNLVVFKLIIIFISEILTSFVAEKSKLKKGIN